MLVGLRSLEALCVLIPLLVLDVLRDHFLVHFAQRRVKIATRPHVLLNISRAYAEEPSCNRRLALPFPNRPSLADDGNGVTDTGKCVWPGDGEPRTFGYRYFVIQMR